MSTLNQMQVEGVIYDIEDSVAREEITKLKNNSHEVTAEQIGAVSYNTVQTLTDEQKVQARDNIDTVSKLHTHDSIIEQNTQSAQKFWSGTKTEYDAISNKLDDTIYMVTGDPETNITQSDVQVFADTDYSTYRVRGIAAGTTDLTENSSALKSGMIYFVYE